MKPNIGITRKNLKDSAEMLSAVLSNEMTLYIKTRKSHWNVAGGGFMELHKLFENQYKELEDLIDQIAERIGKLGEKTIGTMSEFIKLSVVKESPGEYPASNKIIDELLADHETIIIHLRKDIQEFSKKNKDAGTVDFLTGIMEKHETTSWILRRYLK